MKILKTKQLKRVLSPFPHFTITRTKIVHRGGELTR